MPIITRNTNRELLARMILIKLLKTMKNLNKKLTAVSISSFVVILLMLLYLVVSEWIPTDWYVYIIEFLLGVGILSGVLAIIRKCTGAADYDNM